MSSSWRPWARRLGSFGTAQIGTQILGLLAGILVARLLSVEEYAYYALAIAFLTSINVASESGLSSQVVAISGRRMPDVTGFGSLFRTATRYRRRVASLFSFFGAISLFLLLLLNHATIATASLMTLLVVGCIFASVTVSLRSAALTVLYHYRPVQYANLGAASARLAGAALLFPFGSLGAILPLAATWLASMGQGLVLRRAMERQIDLTDTGGHPQDAVELRRAMSRLLPVNLILVAQSQGVSMLLGALGATVVLAQVNAVSRYTLVFGFVSAIVVTVLGPALARSRLTRRILFGRYLSLVGLTIAVLAVLLLAMEVFAPFLLGLLGSKYSGLGFEYTILNIGGAVGAVAATCTGFNLARGWTSGSWLMFPATGVWLLLGLVTLDVTTSAGASFFIATSYLPTLATAGLQALLGFRNSKETYSPQ